MKYKKQVLLRDNRVVSNVSPAQCAKLCMEEGSFQCNRFASFLATQKLYNDIICDYIII